MLAIALEAAPALTGPDARSWLDRLALEHDNLRAALDTAITAGDTERAQRLAAALWRFWQIRGHLHEAEARFLQVLEMPGAKDASARTHAEALIGAGSVAYWRGDGPGMRRWYGAAVEAAERCGDPRMLADALFNLGFAPGEDAEPGMLSFAPGRALFERSLALYRELDDRQGIARTAWALGLSEMYLDDYASSRQHNEEARALAHEVGDRYYEAWAVWDIALLDIAEGDLPAARAGLLQALAAFDEIGDRSGPVLVVQGASIIARHAGHERLHWRLRGAVERMKTQTGVELVRQRLPELRWDYSEQPPTDAQRAEWAAGERLSDAEVRALVEAVPVAGPEPDSAV